MILELAFWISSGLLLYTYIGYSLILIILEKCIRNTRSYQDNDYGNYKPYVSIIVAAYNEEKSISKCIQNLLNLEYPDELYEIIIVSDGSLDETGHIAKRYEGNRVIVLEYKENRGKTAVHNDATKIAKGDVFVFVDADTTLNKEFLQQSLFYLENERYGCGSGDYTFLEVGDIGKGEGFYWRSEKMLRFLEHKLGILPFASSGCFIIRKTLYKDVPVHSDIDNCLPYWSVQKGYMVFYARGAKAFDVTVGNSRAQYKKRVRTALRSAQGILKEIPALIKEGRIKIVWVLISHRLIRWFGGYLMIISLFSNALIALAGKSIYVVIFSLQLVFYLLALLGFLSETINFKPKVLFSRLRNICYSFVLANVAFIHATILLSKGTKMKGWNPPSHLNKK
ncbi:glycosyltransferase [Thermodesulfobacteriota bacterium]